VVNAEVIPGKITKSADLRATLAALEVCKEVGGDFAAGISELRVGQSGLTIHCIERNAVLVLGDGDYERRLRKYFMLKDSLAEREPNAKLIDLRFEDQVVVRGKI